MPGASPGPATKLGGKMRFILVFAGIFVALYTGAFFYIGFKDFDYSG